VLEPLLSSLSLSLHTHTHTLTHTHTFVSIKLKIKTIIQIVKRLDTIKLKHNSFIIKLQLFYQITVWYSCPEQKAILMNATLVKKKWNKCLFLKTQNRNKNFSPGVFLLKKRYFWPLFCLLKQKIVVYSQARWSLRVCWSFFL